MVSAVTACEASAVSVFGSLLLLCVVLFLYNYFFKYKDYKQAGYSTLFPTIFFFLLALFLAFRMAYFLCRMLVSESEEYMVVHILNRIASCLNFSAFSLVVLSWAEIFHNSYFETRNAFLPQFRNLYLALNIILYIFQFIMIILFFVFLDLYDSNSYQSISDINLFTDSVVSFLISTGFGYYGLMFLCCVPFETLEEARVVKRTAMWTGVYFCCFFLRTVVLGAQRIVGKSFNDIILIFLVYIIPDGIPSLLQLVVLQRNISTHLKDTQYITSLYESDSDDDSYLDSSEEPLINSPSGSESPKAPFSPSYRRAGYGTVYKAGVHPPSSFDESSVRVDIPRDEGFIDKSSFDISRRVNALLHKFASDKKKKKPKKKRKSEKRKSHWGEISHGFSRLIHDLNWSKKDEEDVDTDAEEEDDEYDDDNDGDGESSEEKKKVKFGSTLSSRNEYEETEDDFEMDVLRKEIRKDRNHPMRSTPVKEKKNKNRSKRNTLAPEQLVEDSSGREKRRTIAQEVFVKGVGVASRGARALMGREIGEEKEKEREKEREKEVPKEKAITKDGQSVIILDHPVPHHHIHHFPTILPASSQSDSSLAASSGEGLDLSAMKKSYDNLFNQFSSWLSGEKQEISDDREDTKPLLG